jgi:dsDNA-specific endonuclease/ATPase MutS2
VSRSIRNTPGGRQAREVDLHLPSGHAGPEALERQLARVRGELNSAIRAGEKEIIFIHGAGSGRLREALRGTVAAEYPFCACHDASFTRYGYNGATVVTIRK